MNKPLSAEEFEKATADWGFDYDGDFAEDGRWVYLNYATGTQYGSFLLGWEAGYEQGNIDGYYGEKKDWTK